MSAAECKESLRVESVSRHEKDNTAEVNKLRGQVIELEGRYAKLREVHDETRRQRHGYETERDKYKAEHDRVMVALETARASLSKSEAEVLRLDARHTEQRVRAEKLAPLVDSLSAANLAGQRKIRELSRDLDRAAGGAEGRRLQGELEAARLEMARLRDANRLLTQRIEESAVHLQAMTANRDGCLADLQRANRDIVNAGRHGDFRDAHVANLRKLREVVLNYSTAGIRSVIGEMLAELGEKA